MDLYLPWLDNADWLYYPVIRGFLEKMTTDRHFGLGLVGLPLFFLLIPVSLGLAFWLLNFNQASYQQFLAKKENRHQHQALFSQAPARLYQALPGSSGMIFFDFETADARPVIIRQYLEKYHSPLSPYADYIFSVSQKYNLDYRLVVAIAQQESNLGKKIPPGTYNAWGWGIHSQGTLGFSSWEEGIEAVARGLREDYLDKGFVSLEQIAARYAPPSQEAWAFGVGQFMREME